MLATLRQRNFALLWLGGLISLIGDRAMLTALPFYIYQQTGSTVATAAMFTLRYLPAVLLGSIAGVFVDRWDRKRIMIATNLVQACVMLLLLFVRSNDWIWLVYLITFVQASASTLFLPAESAIVPNLVEEKYLIPANSLGALNNNIARLIGPPIGGILIGLFGLSSVAILDSVSFVLAAALFSFISISAKPTTERPTVTDIVVSPWRAVYKEWREGLRLVRQDRLIRGLFVVLTITSFGGTMIDPLFVPFVVSVLQSGPAALGWLSTIGAAGGLLAGFVVGVFGSRFQPRHLTGYGTVLTGLLMLAMYNQTSFAIVMVLRFLLNIPVAASAIGSQTLLQMGVPDRYRGRVYGSLNTSNALIGLVSVGLVGIFGEVLGIVPMLRVAGSITLLAGVIAFVVLPVSKQRSPSEGAIQEISDAR